MKYVVILRGDEYCEPGSMNESLLAEMARYNRALVEAGILLATEELHPSARGARVERSNGRRSVRRGPFGEPGGLIAGFWIWNVASLSDAIEWVKRCPLSEKVDAKFEIRQLYDFGDFGAVDVPDLEQKRSEPLVPA